MRQGTRQRWSGCGCSGAAWRTGCGRRGGTFPVAPSCGHCSSRAPFTSRSFSSPTSVSTWAILVPVLTVCFLLQWGMTRATGIKAGLRPLRVLQDGLFYYRPGRTAGIAMAVVSLAGLGTEGSLIRHGLLAVAIAVAALAVAAEVTAQQAQLRAIRQHLRAGGGAA
jgi:hypothetical protein